MGLAPIALVSEGQRYLWVSRLDGVHLHTCQSVYVVCFIVLYTDNHSSISQCMVSVCTSTVYAYSALDILSIRHIQH